VEWGEGQRAQGRHFRVLGMPDPGTFAEYTTAAAAYVRPRPAHLNWAQAAALPLAGLTAYRAAFVRAQLQAGERVLVTGIGGGVALVAAQLCAAAGAEVWVTSGDDDKLARALALPLGLRGGANYKAEGWAKDLTKRAGGPFDVLIDSAGGAGFEALVDAAAPGGRIVFYGGTQGNITSLPPGKVFWKQLSILGTSMGSLQDFDAMLAFVDEHQLVPIVDKHFSLAEGQAALSYLAAGQQLGKVVLDIA
jgi:NADPH:quinone reductase-like Zn-dependent oxidoreductase